MSCNREWYDEYFGMNDITHIYLDDNIFDKVQGYGEIIVNLPGGLVKQIPNVMYVPGIKKNMISISTITDNNLKVEFGKYKCLVKIFDDISHLFLIGPTPDGS